MPAYEKHQLARNIYTFFDGVPQEQPRPYPYGFYFTDAIKLIEPQLDDPAKVEEIYQMMIPVMESTPKDDRNYPWRKRGFENLSAFRNGTFSLFGKVKTPKPVQEAAPTAQPVIEEALPTEQPESDPELEQARELINAYCMEEFDQEADFSNLSHVDLAFSATSDSEHTVEVYADLTLFQMVFQVDGETVREISCDSLPELNEYLANLEFDRMVADAEEAYTAMEPEAPAAELPAEETQPAALAPPKPRRERVVFTTLHPEIPTEQRSNFRITDPNLGVGTPSEKYAANVAAIRMLNHIEDEKRLATPEEQEVLSRYVGWGGLADYFDDRNAHYEELKSLLSEDEYAAARASSLTAFYTSPVIVEAMYRALGQMGFQTGNILEPSCGVGNFIGMLPEAMAASKVYGVELDSISGRIAGQLYQNSSIAVNGFEKVQMPDSFFDVAIGNVPFGDFKGQDFF